METNMRFPLCMNFTIPRACPGDGSGIGDYGGPADNGTAGGVGGGSNDHGGSDTPPLPGP